MSRLALIASALVVLGSPAVADDFIANRASQVQPDRESF